MDNQTALKSFYWLLNLITICLILFFYVRNNIQEKYRRIFNASLILKLLSCFSSAYIFMHYFEYTTDPQSYFSESKILLNTCLDNPSLIWQSFIENHPTQEIRYSVLPRAYFFIKTIAVLNIITGSNYWLNAIWLSLFCFQSVWYLANTILRFYSSAFIPFVLAFCFVPTTIFWSSGILKEAICFGMLSMLIAHFIHLINNEINLWGILSAFISMYFLFQIKFYFLGAFLLISIPLTLNLVSIRYFKLENDLFKCILFSFFFVSILMIANELTTKIFTVGILDLMYNNHVMFSEKGKVDFFFEGLKEFNPVSFLPYVSEALRQGLFMPLPSFNHSLFVWIESLINCTSICIAILASISLVARHSSYDRFEIQLLVLSLLYVTISALAIGFSTPNWGSLARYKIMYFPFLHALLFYVLSKEPYIKRISARF